MHTWLQQSKFEKHGERLGKHAGAGLGGNVAVSTEEAVKPIKNKQTSAKYFT